MNPKNLSIRGKLYMLSGVTAGVALLLASIALSFQHITTFRQNTVNRLKSVGDVLAANTIAAITFDDPETASEVLASLKSNDDIVAACIISTDGRIFASYVREGLDEAVAFPGSKSPSHEFGSDGALEMFVAIADSDESHGTLYLKSSMDKLLHELYQYAVLVAMVFAAALIAALLFSSRLQRLIAWPIRELAETAERISDNHDYSIRVNKHVNDEIGLLYDAFNVMLEQIESGEKKLIDARNELEDRVQERTSQLTQEMEEKQKIHRRLIDASRQAGMAEVATGVLHNVGNVLNSVNVSADLVIQKLQGSRVPRLIRLSEVVNENIGDLPAFVRSEKGSLLPRMLTQLGSCLMEEKLWIENEVQSLQKNVDHIKKIVSAQQSYGSMFGVTESLNLSAILDDAVNIGGGSLSRHNITLERDYGELPEITSDRHHLMQILVNLVRNAGQAIKSSRTTGGKITLRTDLCEDNFIAVKVIDNGIGIDARTLDRIFSHGFTTKKEGHGFGLHSSALAAREIGGSLDVQSDGAGLGATFTLRIPVVAVARSASAPAV